MNFFVYSQKILANSSLVNHSNTNDEESPVSPEEKSSAKTFSLMQEDYLHQMHIMHELSFISSLKKYPASITEKLQIVHYELISPPPKA